MPWGKGNANKEKGSKDVNDMEEDSTPEPAKKAEATNDGENPYKNRKSVVYHTFLGTPTAKKQRASMRLLNAKVPKVPSTSSGLTCWCYVAAKTILNTYQTDTTPSFLTPSLTVMSSPSASWTVEAT
jgi:hypothetical protein